MPVLMAGIGLIIVTGFIALFIRNAKVCTRVGAAGVIGGCVPAVISSVYVLRHGTALTLQIPWPVPYGSFYVVLDNLSALFLISVCIVCSAAAVYGCGYMIAYKDRRLGIPTFFFNLLTAGMAIVVTARNGVLFLAAWEIMSLASYFLVTFEDEHESVRQAGWIYIAAAHIGTAFLLLFFVLLSKYSGTMDFDRMNALGKTPSILFLLALVGFGTKAGIMPLHVWLPEAHPAAPSHVSAVMSGVMIKMGIYGIIRTVSILPAAEIWWGWLLISLGAISGIFGILSALAQHDLKRMLAYSSVENIGIILIGLGLGIIGIADGSDILLVFGFSGALLHMLNHSLMKSLLFLGAGSVLHATGTRSMDLLGGLIKRMPQTGILFLIGAIAICAVPPLNGFFGEFLLYYGSFSAAITDGVRLTAPTASAIAAIAVIGGFSLAAFTKVFGIIFLGEARTPAGAKAHEANLPMRTGMWILSGLCVILGFTAPGTLPAIIQVVLHIAPAASETARGYIRDANAVLWTVVISSVMFTILVSAFAMLRQTLLSRRTVTYAPTWDCGYAVPTSRMQYTSSSFSQPIVDMFNGVLGRRLKEAKIKDLFPKQAEFESHSPDLSSEYLYRPLFQWANTLLGKMRWVQFGIVQVYVLYIAITLFLLLVWKLR